MKKSILLILLGFCMQGISQDAKPVLIVPFRPDLYINDATIDISDRSGKSFDQILNHIRIALDASLFTDLQKKTNVHTLMTSQTQNPNDNIDLVYREINYYPSPIPNPDKKQIGKSLPQNKKKKTGIHNGQLVSPIVDKSNMFINVKFNETEFFRKFTHEYNTDIFLFINQFEILGDYSDPYKILNNTYNYTIKVHYSIFNSKGKNLYGNCATNTFPASENNIDKICSQYFTDITNQIIENTVRFSGSSLSQQDLAESEYIENDDLKVSFDEHYERESPEIVEEKTEDVQEIAETLKEEIVEEKVERKELAVEVKEIPVVTETESEVIVKTKEKEPNPLALYPAENEYEEDYAELDEQNSTPTYQEVNFNKHTYYLIAGSFKEHGNAVKLNDEMIGKGFSSKIIEEEGSLYRVAVETYNDRALAVRNLKKARINYPDLPIWLLVK